MYTLADASRDSARTLKAYRRRKYERECRAQGIVPRNRHASNAIQIMAAIGITPLAAQFIV